MTSQFSGPDDADAAEFSGPMTGYRVLDLTSVIMGPLSTQLLGDLGADVVFVEGAKLDDNRWMGESPYPTLSGVALNILRNKRSICVDLKEPSGRDLLLRLAATSDVLVTNLRPGPLQRLGLTYEAVRAVRPNIVFVEAHGFPSDTHRSDDPAYDEIIQSASGYSDLARRIAGSPQVSPSLLADKTSGYAIAYAVLAALLHRERTGKGQHIEVAMTEVMQSVVLVEHGASAIPRPTLGPAGYSPFLTERRRPRRTLDGWFHPLPTAIAHFEAIFRESGRDHLIGDPRCSDRFWLLDELDTIMQEKPTAEWVEVMARIGIPFSEVPALEDVIDQLPDAEHPLAGLYKVIPHPVRFGGTPATIRHHAPTPGQHNDAVLVELGYTPVEIEQLRDAGVVHQPSLPA